MTAKTQRKELPPFFNRVNKIAPTFFIEQLQLLGAAVWDPVLKGDVDRVERIQRQAVRFITGDYNSNTPGSISKLLHRSRLPSLQERQKQLRLDPFYKVVEGFGACLTS